MESYFMRNNHTCLKQFAFSIASCIDDPINDDVLFVAQDLFTFNTLSHRFGKTPPL